MKTKTQELLDILTNLKPGLAQKDIVEQMTHFIFTGSNAVTYNDQIYISHPFETPFKTSVPAQELLQLLQKVESKNTILKMEENQLKVKCGKVSAGFSTLVEDQVFKLLPALEKQLRKSKWDRLPEQVQEGLKLTMFSTTQDMMKYSQGLTCVYANKNSITSSDGHRAGIFQLDDSIKHSFLLTAITIPELLKLDPIKYCLTDSWINFKNKEGTVFSVKKIVVEENVLKNVDKFFDSFKKKKRKVKLPQDNLLKAVDVGAIIEQSQVDMEKRIKISISPDELIVGSKRETGWIKTSVEIDYEGKSVEFQIHPEYFSNILNHATTIYIGEDKVFFESGNFKHLICMYMEE